jgi:hypothetical protein
MVERVLRVSAPAAHVLPSRVQRVRVSKWHSVLLRDWYRYCMSEFTIGVKNA